MNEENKIKAQAVQEFVEIMVGALEAGFIDTNTLTIYEAYRVAQNHCADKYGVEMPDMAAVWGDEVAKMTGRPAACEGGGK